MISADPPRIRTSASVAPCLFIGILLSHLGGLRECSLAPRKAWLFPDPRLQNSRRCEFDRRRTGTKECIENLSIPRSEEHTSELQSHSDLVCRLLLEKKKNRN